MIITIPIRPKPAPRPRVTKNGTYNNKDYTDYKKTIGLIAKTMVKPSDKPLSMSIDFVYKKPESWSKKKKLETVFHTSKPDLDNLIKGVKDALNGIAYKDDSQVCRLSNVDKYYGEEDQIIIEIKEIPEFI